jgi:hypothetical protein
VLEGWINVCGWATATALRLAAQNLRTSQSFLGAKYRRFRGRMDAPKAITALAHNLATLIYRMAQVWTQLHG